MPRYVRSASVCRRCGNEKDKRERKKATQSQSRRQTILVHTNTQCVIANNYAKWILLLIISTSLCTLFIYNHSRGGAATRGCANFFKRWMLCIVRLALHRKGWRSFYAHRTHAATVDIERPSSSMCHIYVRPSVIRGRARSSDTVHLPGSHGSLLITEVPVMAKKNRRENMPATNDWIETERRTKGKSEYI